MVVSKSYYDNIEPGDIYNKWTVVSKVKFDKEKRLSTVRVRCQCGTEGDRIVSEITGGKSKGCRTCMVNKPGLKHGKHKSPEYNAWVNIRQRCHNPYSKDAARYHDRGIKVCKRWRDSFDNFYADMGDRPSKNHSIERRDNNKNYTPSNCYWATRKEQMRNRSNTRYVVYKGKRIPLAEAAERYLDMESYAKQEIRKTLARLRSRLDRGHTVEDALKKEL